MWLGSWYYQSIFLYGNKKENTIIIAVYFILCYFILSPYVCICVLPLPHLPLASLTQALRRLNISDLFSENANLSSYIDVHRKEENGIGGGIGGAERGGKRIGERGKGESGITKARVSAIFEKAVVVIDEGGLSPELEGNPNPAGRVIRRTKLFECDRPFAFFIVGNKNKAILFMGVYRGPTEDLIRGIDPNHYKKSKTYW